MAKFMQMLSRNLKIAVIFTIVCVCVNPAFGQRVVSGAGKEPPPQSEKQTLNVFYLIHSDAGEMANVLNQIIPGLNVGIDQRNNAIVVGGTDDKLQTADVLLRRLDTARPSERPHSSPVSVRLVWLVEGDESAAPPAENLKGVIEELRHQGLKNLGQVAQAVVRSQYEDRFQISCSPLLENKPTMLGADGKIFAGGELQIQVTATRSGEPGAGATAPESAAPGRRRSNSEFLTELNVHTVFKTNDYIVLAVAPIGKITSVFVIQITESNPNAVN